MEQTKEEKKKEVKIGELAKIKLTGKQKAASSKTSGSSTEPGSKVIKFKFYYEMLMKDCEFVL